MTCLLNRPENLPNGKVFVAFSGGVDSTALLLLAKSWDLNPVAVHFNHGWESSKISENHTYAVANSLKVPYLLGIAQAPCPGETAAREARMEFFKTLPNGAVLLLGHNLEEQVETIIFQISRGSKDPGIKVVQTLNGKGNSLTLFRPLLTTSKANLEDICTKARVGWIEDPTNSDTTIARNKIRHLILPILSELNARAFEHWSEFNSFNQKENLTLVEETPLQKSVEEFAHKPNLECKELDKLSNHSVKIIVRQWLKFNNIQEVDKGHIHAVFEVVRGARKGCPLPKNKKVTRSQCNLTIQ